MAVVFGAPQRGRLSRRGRSSFNRAKTRSPDFFNSVRYNPTDALYLVKFSIRQEDYEKGGSRPPDGRPSENRLHDATSLSDLGIEKTQAYRWQHIAKVEADVRAEQDAKKYTQARVAAILGVTRRHRV